MDELLDSLLDKYISEQVDAARQAAESCGCASCRGIYKFWLEWAGLEGETEKSREAA